MKLSIRKWPMIFGSLALCLICAFVLIVSCKSAKVIDLDKPHDLSELIGEKVIVYGRANNAKEGALLMGENGMVIMESMDRWVGVKDDERTSAQGVLIMRSWPAQHESDEFVAALPSGSFFYLIPDTARSSSQ